MKRERDKYGHFIKGHKKIGGFVMGSKHKTESIEKIQKSLLGQSGPKARNWKGDNAGYVAIHIWLKNNKPKIGKCSNHNCKHLNPKRFEWASISRKWKRDINDYVELCPSCHRTFDINSLTLIQLYEG